MGDQVRQRETPDDLDVLLAALPPEIVAAINTLPDRTSLIEVVMDLGRRPEARYPGSEVTLLEREIKDLERAIQDARRAARTQPAPIFQFRTLAAHPSDCNFSTEISARAFR